MVVFPAVSALVSLICTSLIARDAFRRPRPDKIAWVIAFGLFTIAAGAEVAGHLAGWTTILARIYYVSGAVLVVGFLALGELYLLAAARIQRFAPGAALLVSAAAATLVWNAPIDDQALAVDGWEAIHRGAALVALTVAINGLGTAVIAGGLGYSAWRFRRLGIQRNRMLGCLLIAIGTLVVAMGGTLTRFGHREYLYIAMAIGVSIIFAGYLATRRPDHARTTTPVAAAGSARATLIALPPAKRTSERPVEEADPAIAFLVAKFVPLADTELAEQGRVWSVPRRDIDALKRDEARAVWALRKRLPPSVRDQFDAHPIAAQLQLAELYHEVFSDTATPTLTRQS